ncbi:hypothetical protein ES708_27581 [subsurface metagenome]
MGPVGFSADGGWVGWFGLVLGLYKTALEGGFGVSQGVLGGGVGVLPLSGRYFMALDTDGALRAKSRWVCGLLSILLRGFLRLSFYDPFFFFRLFLVTLGVLVMVAKGSPRFRASLMQFGLPQVGCSASGGIWYGIPQMGHMTIRCSSIEGGLIIILLFTSRTGKRPPRGRTLSGTRIWLECRGFLDRSRLLRGDLSRG